MCTGLSFVVVQLMTADRPLVTQVAAKLTAALDFMYQGGSRLLVPICAKLTASL